MAYDEKVLAYFSSPPAGINMRLDGLRTALRRRLENGVILMYNVDHWRHKRGHVPRAPDPVDTAMEFDDSKFNFTKADPKETILKVRLRGEEHDVLVNISPLMVGHTVVSLWGPRKLPQGALGREGVCAMFELAALSDRSDFRVVYNGLGAFASVNHLHVHGLYANGLDGSPSTNCFPIEQARRRPLATAGATAWATGGVCIYKLLADELAGSCANGLVFEGDDPADVGAVAGACVEILAKWKVPHNMMVRDKPTPACFLVPRLPQEQFDVRLAGFNAATCEVCGFLVMQSPESFDNLTAVSAHGFFACGASLNIVAFNSLLRRLAAELAWNLQSEAEAMGFIASLSHCGRTGGRTKAALLAAASLLVAGVLAALAKRRRTM